MKEKDYYDKNPSPLQDFLENEFVRDNYKLPENLVTNLPDRWIDLMKGLLPAQRSGEVMLLTFLPSPLSSSSAPSGFTRQLAREEGREGEWEDNKDINLFFLSPCFLVGEK